MGYEKKILGFFPPILLGKQANGLFSLQPMHMVRSGTDVASLSSLLAFLIPLLVLLMSELNNKVFESAPRKKQLSRNLRGACEREIGFLVMYKKTT